MFKRIVLPFTFVAALAVAGLGIGNNKAMAWSDCNSGVGYPYSTYYAGYPGYVSYAPRVAYYPSYPVRSYPVFYGRFNDDYHHHHHDNYRHSGLSISFGF